MSICDKESCLIGISKDKLTCLQNDLLSKGNQKDYYILESVLKGNFLMKEKARKQTNY